MSIDLSQNEINVCKFSLHDKETNGEIEFTKRNMCNEEFNTYKNDGKQSEFITIHIQSIE